MVKARKKVGPFSKKKKGVTRARATSVLAQGAGQATRKAFGNAAKQSIPRGLSLACWNAHASAHAGLPRAVGPYTVVRTTTMITSKSPLLIFGSYALQDDKIASSRLVLGYNYGEKMWTNICAVGAADEVSKSDFQNGSIGDNLVTSIHSIPVPGAHANGKFATNVGTGETPVFSQTLSNTTCVPSAISVQIMNPTAVQAAAGTAIAAVCPVRLDLGASEKSWGQVGSELMSFYKPRVLTGGKLSLRGVQMDSIPLSMTDVSDFREIYKVDPLVTSPSSIHWSDQHRLQGIEGAPALSSVQKSFSCRFSPEGWAPMVYYNTYNAAREPSDRQEMTFLVTTEWRVRFDISNPACASHTLHKPSTDNEWHQMIRKANEALPGVLDIVEKVADTGLKVGAAYRNMMA